MEFIKETYFDEKYGKELVVLMEIADPEEHIEVPIGIQVLAENVFGNCFDTKTIVLPDGLIEVGDSAFGNCFSLKSVSFGEGITWCGDCFEEDRFANPQLIMRLQVGGNIIAPRSIINGFSVFSDPEDEDYPVPLTLDYLKKRFSSVRNMKEKKDLANSVVNNRFVPEKDKKVFSDYLKKNAKKAYDNSEKELLTAKARGKIEEIENIAKIMGITCEIRSTDTAGIVIGEYDCGQCVFRDFSELAFFQNPNVKCVLWIKETTKKENHVAVYKKFNSLEVQTYCPICKNSVFGMESVADECIEMSPDVDFEFSYEDYSDGTEHTVKYVFKDRSDWEDDSCFDQI